MKGLFLIGRILSGSYFIFSGAHHFIDLAPMARAAAHKGVPYPTWAVALAGVLLIAGGLSLLLGWLPRLGIAALVLFLIPVTLTMHQFWNEEGMARMNDMVNFTKNTALLGAVLALVAVPEPWPLSVRSQLSWRGRMLRPHARGI